MEEQARINLLNKLGGILQNKSANERIANKNIKLIKDIIKKIRTILNILIKLNTKPPNLNLIKV